MCLAIGDILCGWNLVTNRCVEKQFGGSDSADSLVVQAIRTTAAEAAIGQYCKISNDEVVAVTHRTNDPVTIAVPTRNVPLFDKLRWRAPNAQLIERNERQFFHSYEPQLKRAQLVIYPDGEKMDGIYTLEYVIRDIVTHVSTFNVQSERNQSSPEIDEARDEKDEQGDDLIGSPTDPSTAGTSSLVIMVVVIALCVIAILLFVVILLRWNRAKEESNSPFATSQRYHKGQPRSNLRGQPSGESIHESRDFHELSSRKNELCEVNYDSAFESRQSPNQHEIESNRIRNTGDDEIQLVRDGDGQSESRSEKDNSDVFISCPSQPGSLSSVDQQCCRSDNAVVILPSGAIKTVKAATLQRIRHEMHDPDPESEKMLHGTLRKTLKKK